MSTQPRAFSLDASAICECCGALEGVQRESSRTAYAPKPLTRWDRLKLSEVPDLMDRFMAANPDLLLCRDCAAEHHAQWDEQWASYYAGLF